MSALNPGYYDEHQLREIGFKNVGENVRVAKNCTVIGVQNISLGNNVRIDGYCTITAPDAGWVKVGSFVHIGGYCLLIGGSGIEMNDYSGLSQGVKVYSRSDDYSGDHMTNPTVPEKYTCVKDGLVSIGRHVIVGAGSVILPGVAIGEGSAIGAQSLVRKNVDAWGIFSGSPIKRLTSRSRKLIKLEEEMVQKHST